MKDLERVYLSPHYDDAVFSCGGTIHRQCCAGRKVQVVTVFAQPPLHGIPLSNLARRLHDRMGAGADAVSIRRAEDCRALSLLGAVGRRLAFREGIYRGDPDTGRWYYPQLADLFGPVDLRDEGLTDAIAEAVAPSGMDDSGMIFHVPLGIGNHVDHQLVHRAGRRLAERGYAVVYYEDYPYADPTHPASASGKARFSLAVACVTLAAQGGTTLLSPLCENDLAARVQGMCAYRSQLNELRDATRVITKHLGGYVRRYDPERMTERFWLLTKGRAAGDRAEMDP